MKNLKTYTIALLLMISYTSLGQSITISDENSIVFLIIKDIKIALKQQGISKNHNTIIKDILEERSINVVCNTKHNLKFLIKTNNNDNLNIRIIKLNKKNNVSDIIFNSKKEKQEYVISIPKIEKGSYAIIVNNSWNLFKIN